MNDFVPLAWSRALRPQTTLNDCVGSGRQRPTGRPAMLPVVDILVPRLFMWEYLVPFARTICTFLCPASAGRVLRLRNYPTWLSEVVRHSRNQIIHSATFIEPVCASAKTFRYTSCRRMISADML